jgi:hypothetical protein
MATGPMARGASRAGEAGKRAISGNQGKMDKGRGIMGIQNYAPRFFSCFFSLIPGIVLGTIAHRKYGQERKLRDHSATKLAFILSLLAKLADFDSLHKAFNVM